MLDATLKSKLDESINTAMSRLRKASKSLEELAEYVPAKRVRLVRQKARFEPLGRVWRLGVFLLSEEGSLWAVGETTRAVDPGHPGYQSISQEQRRAYRAAAFAGPFVRGQTINFAATELNLSIGSHLPAQSPLLIRDGEARVSWRPGVAWDEAPAFARYFEERVDLVIQGRTGFTG